VFDKYIIVGEDFKNVTRNGEATGFQLGVRIPYYRGIQVSQIDDLELTVDSESIPRDRIRVTLHGNTYTLDQFLTVENDRWEFGEVGIVTIDQPGGLKPGEHTLSLAPYLRIGYWQQTFAGRDTKVANVAA
jgi:Domain of unknown function (DUF6379)